MLEIAEKILDHLDSRLPAVVKHNEHHAAGTNFLWDPIVSHQVTMAILLTEVSPLMSNLIKSLNERLKAHPAAPVVDFVRWRPVFERCLEKFKVKVEASLKESKVISSQH